MCVQAVAEKDLGNTAYKIKDFETAMKHYNKAVDLDSTNIIFRNNRAGVFSFILHKSNYICLFIVHMCVFNSYNFVSFHLILLFFVLFVFNYNRFNYF